MSMSYNDSIMESWFHRSHGVTYCRFSSLSVNLFQPRSQVLSPERTLGTRLNLFLHSVAPRKGIRIPESWKYLLVESGILGLGIRNAINDWNPESKFHWKRFRIQSLESVIHGVESRIQGCLGIPYLERTLFKRRKQANRPRKWLKAPRSEEPLWINIFYSAISGSALRNKLKRLKGTTILIL